MMISSFDLCSYEEIVLLSKEKDAINVKEDAFVLFWGIQKAVAKKGKTFYKLGRLEFFFFKSLLARISMSFMESDQNNSYTKVCRFLSDEQLLFEEDFRYRKLGQKGVLADNLLFIFDAKGLLIEVHLSV
ncbi:hypothetical protein [Saprospira grandis]|uniref:hypothetical protein n=1 Tax=Saprospira grandis TaxID=1008 RepID=UPI0022DE9665|nr:hypothetical protein [Saprospira grandis]WBM74883.1 hypothetical protein OP864_01325 [Saprospira grandis]